MWRPSTPKPSPRKPEPAKPSPAKPEPAKPSPAKPEPAKAQPSALDDVRKGKTILMKGSKGAGVKELQQGLVDRGYKLDVDGAFPAPVPPRR